MFTEETISYLTGRCDNCWALAHLPVMTSPDIKCVFRISLSRCSRTFSAVINIGELRASSDRGALEIQTDVYVKYSLYLSDFTKYCNYFTHLIYVPQCQIS